MKSMPKIISEYDDESITYNHLSISNPLDHNLSLHTHDICEILFLKSGNVSGIIDAKTYKLSKNCLIIFRARVPHKILVHDNTDYERYCVVFDENALANRILFKFPKDLDVINLNGNNRMIELFNKFDYYYENFAGDDLKLLMTNLVEEILFNLSITNSHDSSSHLVTTHPLIMHAIDYINTHFAEDIKIEDICKQLYITKSHLHHLFIKNLQISPKKFINIKRLSKAQRLIRSGENPVNVYMHCGFRDYVTFFRNYNAYFGYNPSQENKIIQERKIES